MADIAMMAEIVMKEGDTKAKSKAEAETETETETEPEKKEKQTWTECVTYPYELALRGHLGKLLLIGSKESFYLAHEGTYYKGKDALSSVPMQVALQCSKAKDALQFRLIGVLRDPWFGQPTYECMLEEVQNKEERERVQNMLLQLSTRDSLRSFGELEGQQRHAIEMLEEREE